MSRSSAPVSVSCACAWVWVVLLVALLTVTPGLAVPMYEALNVPPAPNGLDGMDGATESADPPQAACRLPRDRGRRCPSSAPTRRWYLDEEQADCVSFWFTGCGGNANNFATEAECRSVCVEATSPALCLLPAGRGPCTDSQLLWTFDSETGQCGTFVYGGCYGTANRFFTRRQCERACGPGSTHGSTPGGGGVEPECLLRPGMSGQCGAELVRYTYLAAADVCTPFLNGGCAGNANNFETMEECSERCQTLADTDDALKDGQNSTEPTTEKSENEPVKPAEGGADGTDDADSSEVCFLPRDSGSCLSYAPMFYHDVRTADCHQFIYRGCGGNGNRFHTFSECRQRCVRDVEDEGEVEGGRRTGEGTDEGVGDATGDGVALNATGGETSDAGGALERVGDVSNTSTAVTEVAVGSTPIPSVEPPPTDSPTPVEPPAPLAAIGPDQQTGHLEARQRPRGRRRRPRGRRACLLRPLPGPCHHYLPQFYYYNADLAGCFTFIYGGCGGNPNRFRTREECESFCKGVRRSPSSAGRGGIGHVPSATNETAPAMVAEVG